MAKYIDAEQLKNAFTNWREIVNNPYDLFPSVEECKAVIDAQPTAEVQEVKHGRWEYVKKRLARGGYVDASECSVCHKIIMPHLKPNYCPNCGAKMERHFEEPEINPCRGCEDYDGKGGCISNGGCGASMDGDTE